MKSWTPAQIKAARLSREWSQQAMAQALRMSIFTVQRREQGRSKPSMLARQALTRLFGDPNQYAVNFLYSTDESAATRLLVRRAYRQSPYFLRNEPRYRAFDEFFEHGQWWIRDYPKSADKDEVTYSVVDAEGPRSIDGFDFEEI